MGLFEAHRQPLELLAERVGRGERGTVPLHDLSHLLDRALEVRAQARVEGPASSSST